MPVIVSRPPGRIVRAALYLYVASLPFEFPARSIPLEYHTLTGGVLVLAALTDPRAAYRAPSPAFWLYAIYALVYLASGVLTNYLSEWLRGTVLLLQLLGLFWVTTNLLRHVPTARTALLVLAGSCCVLAFMQQFGIATSVEVGAIALRQTVLGQNANTLAHNLSLGLLALVGLAYAADEPPKLRLLYLTPCALLALAIMPTAARGALLALMMGMAIIALSGGSLRARARSAAVVVAVLAGLALAAYRTDGMRNRLVMAAESNDLSHREELFPAAWQMFMEKPLIGWGPINNRYEVVKYVPRAELAFRETHNVVLELLTENGLLGAIPYLTAMLLSVVAAWRARSGPHGVLPLAMVFTVLAGRMGTAGVLTKMHWFVLAFAVAADVRRSRAPAAPALAHRRVGR